MKTSRIHILLTVIIGLFGCNSDKTNNEVKNELLENSKNDSAVLALEKKMAILERNETLFKDTLTIYQPTDLKSDSLFDKNAIGVVYLDSTDEEYYHLYIQFHSYKMPYSFEDSYRIKCGYDFPIEIPSQTISLFDEAGRLATIKDINSLNMQCWCQDDGGNHICPTLTLSINKKELIRPILIKNARLLNKLACFAVINFDSTKLESFYPETIKNNENIVMRGRILPNYEGANHSKPLYYDCNVLINVDRKTQLLAEQDKTANLEHCVYVVTMYNGGKEIFCCGP
jgi:hypothetical protein